MQKVPVVINNYNRYEPFRKLVTWLKTLPDISEIVVCDNNSKYPPLVEYYKQNPDNITIKIYDHNGGHLMPKNLLRDMQVQDRVIVTDPDLIPYDTTPPDFIEKLNTIMDKYVGINKVGAGLSINDIPDHYPFAENIRRHERSLLLEWLPDGSRKSLIDTTFCLYRCKEAFGNWQAPAIRTASPYILKHVDWYIDPMQITPEYAWYMDQCTESASYAFQLKDWYKLRKINYHTKVVKNE